MQIEITPPELHEIITSLHRNRCKVGYRIRWDDRRRETEPVKARMEADPTYKSYLDAIRAARVQRVETITQLIQRFETLEK